MMVCSQIYTSHNFRTGYSKHTNYRFIRNVVPTRLHGDTFKTTLDNLYSQRLEKLNAHTLIQCVRKVAVHLGYGRVQLKSDGTRWRTGGEVRKVTVQLQKALEVMSTSVYTDLNPFHFIRKHFLHICLCDVCYVSAQRLSERTVHIYKR